MRYEIKSNLSIKYLSFTSKTTPKIMTIYEFTITSKHLLYFFTHETCSLSIIWAIVILCSKSTSLMTLIQHSTLAMFTHSGPIHPDIERLNNVDEHFRVFLPPNVIVHLQPVNQNIIAKTKIYTGKKCFFWYKQGQCNYICKQVKY